VGLVAGLAALLLLLLIVGGAFAFTNGFGLLNRPAATSTPAPSTSTATLAPSSTATPLPTATVPVGSETPDRVGTQLASLQDTQAAIQAGLATATPTNTPDLTQTQAACTFGYSVSAQQPEDNKALPLNSNISKTLTLLNTGTCPFEAGTVFTQTNPVGSAQPITAAVPAIQPNATGDIALHWPGRKTPGDIVRVFEMLGPDAVLIGEPITLTQRYIVVTPVPPKATATPVPPPATATLAVPPSVTPGGGLTSVYLSGVTGCSYVGDTQADYACVGIVGQAGGIGPFTVSVDGANGRHVDVGQTITINIVGRRCLAWAHTINLFDDGTQSGISNGQFFDPTAHGNLFPGGACTTP
jgi:hypothetical protein